MEKSRTYQWVCNTVLTMRITFLQFHMWKWTEWMSAHVLIAVGDRFRIDLEGSIGNGTHWIGMDKYRLLHPRGNYFSLQLQQKSQDTFEESISLELANEIAICQKPEYILLLWCLSVGYSMSKLHCNCSSGCESNITNHTFLTYVFKRLMNFDWGILGVCGGVMGWKSTVQWLTL